MKTINTGSIFGLVLILVASGASAREIPVEASTRADSVHFAWADVLRVNPQYDYVAVTREDCREEQLDNRNGVNGAKPGSRDANPSHCRKLADGGYEQRRITGYDVEYRYRGEIYMARLHYDPGDRLRVRVSVTPAE